MKARLCNNGDGTQPPPTTSQPEAFPARLKRNAKLAAVLLAVGRQLRGEIRRVLAMARRLKEETLAKQSPAQLLDRLYRLSDLWKFGQRTQVGNATAGG